MFRQRGPHPSPDRSPTAIFAASSVAPLFKSQNHFWNAGFIKHSIVGSGSSRTVFNLAGCITLPPSPPQPIVHSSPTSCNIADNWANCIDAYWQGRPRKQMSLRYRGVWLLKARGTYMLAIRNSAGWNWPLLKGGLSVWRYSMQQPTPLVIMCYVPAYGRHFNTSANE